MKAKSLGTRFILIISIIMVLVYTGIFALMSYETYTAETRDEKSILTAKSENYASILHEVYMQNVQSAKDLEIKINHQMALVDKNRLDIIEMLVDAMKTNDRIYGMSVCFEPDAFDGKDGEFMNKSYHDATGRFIPYVSRGANGLIIKPSVNCDEALWYSIPKKTNKMTLTEPYPFEDNGKTLLLSSMAFPIKEASGKFMGVIAIDTNITGFQDLVKTIDIEGANAMVLSAKGTYVANGANPDLIMKNMVELNAKSSETVRRIAKGEQFTLDESSTGEKSLKVYVPVRFEEAETNWSLACEVPYTIILQNFYRTLRTLIFIALGALVLTMLIIMYVMRVILSRPIHEVLQMTKKVAHGELDVTLNYKSNNELGHLSEGVMTTVRSMQTYIGNIAETLGRMAEGDLSVTVDMEYMGDFAQIKKSMMDITDSLNDILSQINRASNQVLSGAGQVSNAAQSLSQGTAEQASSIEELSASIEEISNEIKKNAQNARDAKDISLNSTKIIEDANEQMTEMIAAMEKINETSKKISKIIKTIDDIAFQTNILALNAAVEAARAGEAGKGFAVVADEVRNLASKSAEAAKDTTVLIENSIQAVHKGTKIADETAKSLAVIVEESKRSADLINLISEASSLQAQAIAQTTLGIGQISNVVQTNSATAEQSAAASEELSGQADMLNQLVGKFTLRAEKE